MRKRFVLALAAIVAALVGYNVVFERGSLSSKELDERKGRVLPTFVRDHLTRLALTRDGKTLVIERKLDDDGTFSPWKLIAPIASPCRNTTPRSKGMESKPQENTMRAPEALAAAS